MTSPRTRGLRRKRTSCPRSQAQTAADDVTPHQGIETETAELLADLGIEIPPMTSPRTRGLRPILAHLELGVGRLAADDVTPHQGIETIFSLDGLGLLGFEARRRRHPAPGD